MRTKDQIRQRVWDDLKRSRAARFPGAEGRIPNFIGAEACARQLAGTAYWKAAQFLKVNPDSPQRAIRRLALADGKTVYMAVPRLRSEKPFIELDPKKLKCSAYTASSVKGAFEYGRPVTIDQVRKIDLVVCGSVAVNRAGARVGKAVAIPTSSSPSWLGKKSLAAKHRLSLRSIPCRSSMKRFR